MSVAIGMPVVDFPLYLITDRSQTLGRSLRSVLVPALRAGVRAVQLRERDLDARSLLATARDLSDPVREAGAQLFVNDRVDVAMRHREVGLHLRSDSLPISVARRLLGRDRLIGVSTHSPDDVLRAESEGADFVVLGPVYETPSKKIYGAPIGLHLLEDAATRSRIPIFAIGGITSSRVPEVRRAGAFGIAVVTAILASRDVEAATHDLLDALAAPL